MSGYYEYLEREAREERYQDELERRNKHLPIGPSDHEEADQPEESND